MASAVCSGTGLGWAYSPTRAFWGGAAGYCDMASPWEGASWLPWRRREGGGGGGGGLGGIGGSQSLRLHHPEIVNLPNLARAEHLNHYYKAHHFNNNMLGLGLGGMSSGMGLINNNNNPSPCSQGGPPPPGSGPMSCSQMPMSMGSGTATLGSLPTPVPLPQLSIHGSLKGLMGKGQNSQIEPLLFKSGSKENVQETQI